MLTIIASYKKKTPPNMKHVELQLWQLYYRQALSFAQNAKKKYIYIANLVDKHQNKRLFKFFSIVDPMVILCSIKRNTQELSLP